MENKKATKFLQKKGHQYAISNPKDLSQSSKDKHNEEFDKNRKVSSETKEKKPFDKKSYRLKKYSKKYKLEQWEDHRKKKVMRDYYKDIKNDPMTGTYKPINYDEIDGTQQMGKYVRHPNLIKDDSEETLGTNGINNIVNKKSKDPYWKAKEKIHQLKQDKVNKKLEIDKAKQERNQKLLEYKKKKQERFKKLSKKTKRGQPVMTGRLELLLEKIQNNK